MTVGGRSTFTCFYSKLKLIHWGGFYLTVRAVRAQKSNQDSGQTLRQEELSREQIPPLVSENIICVFCVLISLL